MHPDFANLTKQEREDKLLTLFTDKAALPALGIAVSKVMASLSTETDSIQDLANFILADVSLTQQILKVANSVNFRRTGTPCSMVSKAIIRIGFENVKGIALATTLLDSISHGQQASQLKAEFAHSFFSSVMARELVKRANYKNPEEIAIAGLFKNLGKMLLAKVDFGLYSDIMDMARQKDMSEQTAAAQTVGVTFERMAELVLQAWAMPEAIVNSIRPVDVTTLKKGGLSHEDWLRVVVSFSSEAAHSISHTTGKNKEREISKVLGKYADIVGINKEKFNSLVDVVGQETISLSAGMGLPAFSYAPAGEAQDKEVAIKDILPAEAIVATEGGEEPGTDVLMQGVQEVAGALVSDSIKINEIANLVLETIYRGLHCQHVVLCIHDTPNKKYKAKFVVGEKWQTLMTHFSFSDAYSPDLFHAALSQNVDLQIRNLHNETIQQKLPEWYAKLFPSAKSFILLPLVINNKIVGFLYADRFKVMPHDLSKEKMGLLKTLRSQLAMAIKLSLS